MNEKQLDVVINILEVTISILKEVSLQYVINNLNNGFVRGKFKKGNVEESYHFSTGIDKFIACYKKSAKSLGASRMKEILISHSKNNLNVRLFF